MEMKFKPHTVIMLVGPTECGKTTFAKEILIPSLQYEDAERNMRMNVQYISSDDIRREILGYEYDKHDYMMMEASQNAFDLLFKKLEMVISYPVSAEFVVLDTTGLSEEFREKVKEIANRHHYHVDVIVFNFTSTFEFYNSEKSKKLIESHVRRLRMDVLRNLKRKDYHQVYVLKRKNFLKEESGEVNREEYVIEIDGLEDYVSHFLPYDNEYVIVGDVHEKVDELKKLLMKHRFEFEGDKIVGNKKNEKMRVILAGDWIDKGKETKRMVEFLKENKEWFYLVKGNHENVVFRYLRGEINELDPEYLENYFTSIEVLEKDEELRKDFEELVEASKVFYVGRGGMDRRTFYVTHAPCKEEYLGKTTEYAYKKQMNFYLDREKDIEEQLGFLKEQDWMNFPYHVFGHIASKDGIQSGTKLGIDTGAVYGNKLTSVLINSDKPYYVSVNVEGEVTEDLPELFKKEREHVKIEELTKSEKKKLDFVLANKINFISGTMSPSDKDEEKGELESLEKALEYYKKNGVKEVILEPKYMGSRCNIYLDKDLDKCFAVSRNGYKITSVDLTEIYKKLLEKFKDYMEENNVRMLILDGELLPWRALGKSLIENSFKSILLAVEQELNYLEKYGFEREMQKLLNEFEESGFKYDRNVMKKKELYEKFGARKYQNYKNLVGYKHVEVSHLKECLETYREQIEIFGSEGELDYKPFDVLKIVKENGEEEFMEGTVEDIFTFVSDDEYVVVDVTTEEGLEKAREFFATLTVDRKMEGVVVKPLRWKKGVLPFMKVRNEKYLTLVYGYDYKVPHKYEKLVRQKDIRSKVKTSLVEYELGREMLNFKWDEIHEGNEAFKQVVADLIFEVRQEEGIDPRL